jgi:hypothetical protein
VIEGKLRSLDILLGLVSCADLTPLPIELVSSASLTNPVLLGSSCSLDMHERNRELEDDDKTADRPPVEEIGAATEGPHSSSRSSPRATKV